MIEYWVLVGRGDQQSGAVWQWPVCSTKPVGERAKQMHGVSRRPVEQGGHTVLSHRIDRRTVCGRFVLASRPLGQTAPRFRYLVRRPPPG
jgi:hypothetical protein